jgi:uncharacterized protein
MERHIMPQLRNALVTGASSGIGRELVRQLVLDRGMTVLATARRADRLETLAAELPGGRVEIVAGDLCDPGFRDHLWDRSLALPGGIDLLINNAGVGNYAELIDQDAHVVRQIVELNLVALIDLSRKAARHMKTRKYGQILQMSSVLGFVGMPASAVYVATKHAVNGFVKSLRYELRGTGVRVWAACPGQTQSEFRRAALGWRNQNQDEQQPSTGEPTDSVVRAIVKAIDGSRTFFVPTWRAWAVVFLARWMPGTFDWLMGHWAKRWYREVLRRESDLT